MTARTRREVVHFKHPFQIKGIDRLLAPGAYEVIVDEEMIEGLSFACFRRAATMIVVPAASLHQQSTELLTITAVDLADAQHRDAVTTSNE